MDVPNVDQFFMGIWEWLNQFKNTNPGTTAFLIFLVGWAMKRSPVVEHIVQLINKYRK